jgi:hypothetical protein
MARIKKADAVVVEFNEADTITETSDEEVGTPVKTSDEDVVEETAIHGKKSNHRVAAVEVKAVVTTSLYCGGRMVHLVRGETVKLPQKVAEDWKQHKYVE